MRMPERFEELAEYNARVAKGIVHTREYRRRMAELQREFDTWQDEQAEACKPLIDALKVATGAALITLFGAEPVKQQVHVHLSGEMDADAAAAMRANLMRVAARAARLRG